MEKRRLGGSDVEVTPIGLGAWQFSDSKGIAGKFWPALDQVPSKEIVRAMLDGGVNWFDTAEMYGHGASERCLARDLQALGEQPGQVVIATKWMPFFRGAGSLLSTIPTRIDCLRPYPIDLHQIHAPISLSTIGAEMKAMANLLEKGHVRAGGISNYSASQMRRAHAALKSLGFPLASNQMEYSVLNRRIESNGVMDTAKELGISIIAYSPLAQGLCTGRFHDDPSLLSKRAGLRRFAPPLTAGGLRKSHPVIDVLKRIAAKYNATPAQVSLNWLVHFHGQTVVAIPGATKTSQAQQNTGAMAFTLTTDELAEIDDVSRPFK